MPSPQLPAGSPGPTIAVPTLLRSSGQASRTPGRRVPQPGCPPDEEQWDFSPMGPEDSQEMHRAPREPLRRSGPSRSASRPFSAGRGAPKSGCEAGPDELPVTPEEMKGSVPNIPRTSSKTLKRVAVDNGKVLILSSIAGSRGPDSSSGPPLCRQELLADIITTRVESGKSWRSGWREAGQETDIPPSNSATFGVSRLGVPTGGSSASSSSAAGRQKTPARPRESPAQEQGGVAEAPKHQSKADDAAGPPAQQAPAVRYIHIPKHALAEFRDFAKDVAREASREVAATNPYAQALSKHREDLETPLVADGQTKEQKLGIERDALCVLRAVSLLDDPVPAALGPEALGMCYGDSRCAPAECCQGRRGELVRVEPSMTDVVLAQPILTEEDEPSSARSRDSGRSAQSTTCSRRSTCEERGGIDYVLQEAFVGI